MDRPGICRAALLLLLPGAGLLTPGAAESVNVTVDFAAELGRIRPLHGINKGPVAAGGRVDVSDAHRALGVPWTRLHDCHWPNPDVVDIHVVFPDPNADPENPASYDFKRTDEYIDAIRRTGAQIVYRLGESIEHSKVKRFVHPPASPEKWAAVCLGIIRHYNEGWANGFHHNIRYWEIWNEPENRPAMWSGSDADYFALYRTASREIKTRFPGLKIGGPSVGNTGVFDHGKFLPSDFLRAFLDFCAANKVPCDFFSWHCYTDDPDEVVARAKAMRELVDARGLHQTEIHLNEWNYLPDKNWQPLVSGSEAPASVAGAAYARMAGPAGAAFIAATLIKLQSAPVDMANLFHGEVGGFGLFNEHGVPQPNYWALRAFGAMLDTPERVEVEVRDSAKLAGMAGINPRRDTASILLSGFGRDVLNVFISLRRVPWSGPTTVELRRIDQNDHFDKPLAPALVPETNGINVVLASPAVALLTLKPAAPLAVE